MESGEILIWFAVSWGTICLGTIAFLTYKIRKFKEEWDITYRKILR